MNNFHDANACCSIVQSLSVEGKVCQSHAEGFNVTKHSFSNSVKRYYSDLADSGLEPSLIKYALVYQYLYKKYSRLPITRTLANSNLVLTRTKIDFPRISVIHSL